MDQESPKPVNPKGDPQVQDPKGVAPKGESASVAPAGGAGRPEAFAHGTDEETSTKGSRAETSAPAPSDKLQDQTPPPESPAPLHSGQRDEPPNSVTSPRMNRWGVLVREEIKSLKLIRVPDPEYDDQRCYAHASYDLRLGHEYIMLNAGEQHSQLKISSCEKDGIITIQPFASVIVSTYESVALPDNVVGRFDLRIQHALEGLIVQRGTQVEPGYPGQLFALLHNISDQRKSLKFRDYDSRLFTIEFSYTSEPSKPQIPPKSEKRGLRDFVPPNCARGGIDGTLQRIREVQGKVDELSRDFTMKKMIIFTGATLFIIISIISSVIPYILTKFTYDKDYFPIVNAQAISTMKEDAIAARVLRELEARPSAATIAPPERLYVERLIQLKARRDSLKGDPSRSQELKSIQKEIDELVELLKK